MNTKSLLNPLHCLKLELATSFAKDLKKSLFYIPMITPSQEEVREDSKQIIPPGLIRNKILLELQEKIKRFEPEVDYGEIKSYFYDQEIECYMHSRTRGRHTFFTHENRIDYFDKVLSYFVNLNQKSIVFIDPDIGSDIGLVKRERPDPEKYLFQKEIELLAIKSKQEDIIMFFQSFTSNAKARLNRMAKILPMKLCYYGFQRYQGGLVIGTRDTKTFKILIEKLEYIKSEVKRDFKEIKPILIELKDY